MRNKIINFFYRNRIIDSHIGIWDLHIWLYLLATYFNMYVMGITFKIKRFYIFEIVITLNKNEERRLFDIEFKIFNIGFRTSEKYYSEINKRYEEDQIKRKKERNKFVNTLTQEELKKAIKYKELN